METSRVEIESHLTQSEALASAKREVRRGLMSHPKTIPSKFFYDARGSVLFEEITQLPEYYPTRAEHGLLRESAEEVARISRPEDLVELGAGSSSKARILIGACRREGSLKRYVPLEVSAQAAEEAARDLASSFPWLQVHAIIGDFERDLERLPRDGRRLVMFLGGTIGNFQRERAGELVRAVANSMGPDDRFLLGTDLVKDKATLDSAYNDSRGVTAEFNRNILRVLNHRYGGDFEPSRFEHVAMYRPELRRIEMHLRSKTTQTVRLEELDLTLDVDEGESIRTEVSNKYTRESVEQLLAASGLVLERWYTDDAFALSLSRLD